VQIISIVLFFILFTLAMLHFYWAFGGKWAFENTLPQNESGKRVLNQNPVSCVFVGTMLSMFGLFVLIKSKIILIVLPIWLSQYGFYFLFFLFTARAIGDFNYVGFFKKIKNTTFGRLDYLIYSPVSLLIGILFLILEII